MATLISMVMIGNVQQNVLPESYLGGEANVHQNVRTWTAHTAVPGRVEEVPVLDAFPHGPSWAIGAAGYWDRGEVEAIICPDEWACFRQGYRDFGGRPEWENRFVDVIDKCESEGHGWEDTYPLYISRAQFDPHSWSTAASNTRLADPANPYHVGGNVAWWSNATDPGGSGGWPFCWKVGTIPP